MMGISIRRLRKFSFRINIISKYRTELMGVAMIGVMCGHLMNHTFQPSLLGFVVRMVHTPGFLFLSGMGLYYSFSKNSNLSEFYYKRFNRLLLPYFIISSVFFGTFLLFGHISILNYIGYVSTLAYWYEGNIYAMWYISVTVMFYALFPLIYKCILPPPPDHEPHDFIGISIRSVAVLFLFLIIFSMLSSFFPEYWDMHKFGLTKSIMFPIGVYCGYLAKSNISLKVNYFMLFMLICVVLLSFPKIFLGDYFSVVRSLLGIPVFAILIGFLDRTTKNEWILNVLKYCGKYSLELYLLHVLVYFSLVELFNIPSSYAMVTGIVIGLSSCSFVSRKIRLVQDSLQSK